MEFFSNSKPDLVGPKVKKSVFKIIKSGGGINSSFSDKISEMVSTFYKDYISEHKWLFIIIILIIIFLLYRYYNKDKKRGSIANGEKFSIEERHIINAIMDTDKYKDKDTDKDNYTNRNIDMDKYNDNVDNGLDDYSVNLATFANLTDFNSNEPYHKPYVNQDMPLNNFTPSFVDFSDSKHANDYNMYISNVKGDEKINYKEMLENLRNEINNDSKIKIGPEYLNDTPEIESPFAD